MSVNCYSMLWTRGVYFLVSFLDSNEQRTLNGKTNLTKPNVLNWTRKKQQRQQNQQQQIHKHFVWFHCAGSVPRICCETHFFHLMFLYICWSTNFLTNFLEKISRNSSTLGVRLVPIRKIKLVDIDWIVIEYYVAMSIS